MRETFQEADVRALYRLLRHEGVGFTELRLIDPNRKEDALIAFLDSENLFVEACRKWNGKKQVYVGLNPRIERLVQRLPQARNRVVSGIKGAEAADVASITLLAIDIDPRRAKGTPSTDREHALALGAAERLSADYPNSVVIDSGNGAHVLFPVHPVSINGDVGVVTARVKVWEAEIREEVESDQALAVDSVHDLPRVLRVPGTLNIKGVESEERPHRIARIVSEISSNLCDMTEVFARDVEVQEDEVLSEGEVPDRFQALLETDERIRRTWNGERQDLSDSSRSGYDMAMIGLLLSQGFSPEEVLSTVLAMPSGTRDERRVRRSLQKGRSNLAGKGRRPRKTKEILAADAADGFLRERNLTGKLRRWRGDWWLWNERSYDRMSEEECQAAVIAYLRGHSDYRSHATQTFARNVQINLGSLGSLPDAIDLPFLVQEPECERVPHLVILQSGIIDVERYAGGHLDVQRPHTPALFSPTLLPFAFDPHATCPRWRAFLAEVLPDADAQQFLQEWFGYNLVYDLSQQRFVILEGDGANGKSVVCTVLRQLLGVQNVSAVPLEVFGVRFQLGPTLGKLANIVPEMGEMDRVSEGHLKPFVSGDAMQFDRKNKEPITAEPTARATFATNTRPRFGDRSEGIWRRLILVPFTVTIPPERQDRRLGDKLIEELPGIFNWAVQGLQRLRERGHFVEPTASQEAKEDYRRETNPALVFLEEECEEDPRHSTKKLTLHQKYCTWAIDRGYRPLGLAQFSKEVHRRCPSVRSARPWEGPERVHVFEGIGLVHE